MAVSSAVLRAASSAVMELVTTAQRSSDWAAEAASFWETASASDVRQLAMSFSILLRALTYSVSSSVAFSGVRD